MRRQYSIFFFLYPIYLAFKWDALNETTTFLGPFYLLHLLLGIVNHIQKCENEIINKLDIYYCHLIVLAHLYILFNYKIYHYNYLVISIIFMIIVKYIYDKLILKSECLANYENDELAQHSFGLHLIGALANTFFILALLE
jgi:hypothetical protein